MNKALILLFLACVGGGVFEYVQTDRELAATRKDLASAQAQIEELQAQLANPQQNPRIAQAWTALQVWATSIEESRKAMLSVYGDLGAWRDELARHQQGLLEYETWLRGTVSQAVRDSIAEHDRMYSASRSSGYGSSTRGPYESQSDYEHRMAAQRLAYANSPEARLSRIEDQLGGIQNTLLWQNLDQVEYQPVVIQQLPAPARREPLSENFNERWRQLTGSKR